MTSEERKVCRRLMIVPPRGVAEISKDAFVKQLPSFVEQGHVSLTVVDEAYQARSAEDVQCVLIVGHTFDFTSEHIEILSRLVDADWHVSHEDVVAALGKIRSPAVVPALLRATQLKPAYLAYDDSRALAVKAIWALGRIPSLEAESGLESLSRSEDAILQAAAAQQLRRRHKGDTSSQ